MPPGPVPHRCVAAATAWPTRYAAGDT